MARADSQEEYETLRKEAIELSRSAASAWRLGFGFVAVLIGYATSKLFDLLYLPTSASTALMNHVTGSRGLGIVMFLLLVYIVGNIIVWITLRLRLDSETASDRLGGYLAVMHDRRFFNDDVSRSAFGNYGWYYWNRFEKWDRSKNSKVPELSMWNLEPWTDSRPLGRITVSKATDQANLAVVKAIFLFVFVFSLYLFSVLTTSKELTCWTFFFVFFVVIIEAAATCCVVDYVKRIAEEAEYRTIYWSSRWKEVVETFSVDKQEEFEKAVFGKRISP